jgi:sigma-B regulation protein RsbU (phosphoserine phosphatase)
MNRPAEELTGYKQNELMGRCFLSAMEVEEEASDPMSRWKFGRFHRKDGGVLDAAFALWRLVGDGDGDGSTLLRLRRRAGRRDLDLTVAEFKEKLDAIFDTVTDGLILINEAGEIQLFNAGAERLFGYRRDEVFGQNVKMLMPSPFREAHDRYLGNYLATGEKKIIGIGREVVARRKDGSVFPIYLSIGELWLNGRRLFVGVTHDLTKLKEAEQQLLTLSFAVAQSPTAVLISNKAGVIEYVNDSFTRLTGYAADELIGRNPSLLRSNHTARDQYERLWETIRNGREWRGEIEDRKKNGETYWALETITPLRDARGEITHYLAIQQDVTEQKRDKEALVESEARFRHVADMTGEWLWEQDPSGRYIYSSGAVRDILAFEPEEILGRNYLDLQVGDDEISSPVTTARISPDRVRPFSRLVNKYHRKDGREVYTESSGAPIFDDQGRVVKWRGVDHDITTRKAFEDALRLRDRAIESVHVGIAIGDGRAPGNPNIYVNPALCRMTGYTREELLGKSMRLLRGPETDAAALEQIREAIAAGRDCEITLRNYRKGGAPFWNELLISPVADESGKITHYIGIHTDVTERRKADESRRELEIAKHIQLSLLPDAPLRSPHAELAGICVPATHVGGDYFDFFHNGDAIDLVIADVSGHSVGAALIMTAVRSTLRAETRKTGRSPVGPARVLRDLNELLYDDLNKAELFITMFYMKFNPETRILKFANAGHNWALLLRSGRPECAPLDADGLVLGVLPIVDFVEKSVKLSSGDTLLLYTDGVIDAQNARGEFFGFDRLCASFTAYRTLPPEALIKRLLSEVRAFCGEEPLVDDLAIVAMQVH